MDISSYAMSDLLSSMNQMEQDNRARTRRNELFRSNPAHVDSMVAAITANISPSGKKPKMGDFATKTDAYDSSIPADHPLAKFGSELKERLQYALNDRETHKFNPADVATALTQKMLMEPGKSGASRLQESFEYKRRTDAEWFSDKSVRKPLGSSYDTWLAGVREAEKPESIAAELRKAGKNEEADAVLRDASPLATPGGLALNMAIGAGAGALAGAKTGRGPGAILGALGGAAQEVFGRPIAKMMEESEWYKSKYGPLTATRETPGTAATVASAATGAILGGIKFGYKGAIAGGMLGAGGMGTDVGRQMAVDVAPYIVTGIPVDAALFNTFLVPKAAGKVIAAKPFAKTVIEGAEAIEQSKTLMSNDSVVGRMVNKLFDGTHELGLNEDVVKVWDDIVRRANGKDKISKNVLRRVVEDGTNHAAGIADQVAEVQAGKLTAEEYTALASRSMEKITGDPIAFEEAMRHPDGIVPGAIEAAARIRPRKLAEAMTSKITAEEVETEISMANAALNKGRGKSERIVARIFNETDLSDTHNVLYTGKGSIPLEGIAPAEDAHGVLYGGNHAVTATEAKAVDSLAEARGVKPKEALAKVTELKNTFEADPVTRGVLDVTTAPLDGEVADAATSFTGVKKTAVTLSAKMQKAKEELLFRRMSPEDQKAYLEEKSFNQAVKLREERLASKERLKALDEAQKPDAVAATETEVQGRTKAEKQNKIDEEFGTGIATDKEAASTKPDVIRRKKGLAPEEQPPVAAAKQATKLGVQKAVEEAAASRAASILRLTPDQASEVKGNYFKAWKEGKMTAEQALDEISAVDETFAASDKFATEEGLGNFLGESDGMVSQLRKVVGSKTFMAVFGLGATAMSPFLGDKMGTGGEAEAGTFDKFALGLMKAAKEAGYAVSHNIPENQFLLPLEGFQRGLKGTAEGGPSVILSKLNDIFKSAPTEKLRHKLMSPHMILDEVFGAGKMSMSNPGFFKASYQASEYGNIINSQKVVGNVLRESGIESAYKEVRKAFAPLKEGFLKQVEFDYRSKRIEDLTGELKILKSGEKKGNADFIAEDISRTEKELAEHSAALGELKGAVPQFQKDWAVIAEQMAKEHSSVRTFLALGDSKGEKYPFLKNIQFSADEKVAIGRMKEQLLVYKQRMKDIGEETIAGDYAPHIMHPDVDVKSFVKTVGGDASKANTYMRFFRRSFNSRPMLPDLEASMMRYTGDAERRIQQETFWKVEGWQNLMEKTKEFPVIYNAFNNLKEGVAPVEASWSNKIAQRYQEFEVVKRLFLSPSATLKHFIKQTGDLASKSWDKEGLVELKGAYSTAASMVGARLAEVNPAVRAGLTKLGVGVKTEQDRLIQDYFKSTVPAQGARKMALDMGLTQYEEVFAKAKGLWGKIQDVGGAGINFAEVSDRGLTLAITTQMAAKKGMTIEQAMYGTYEMLLKNNFLGREFNPAWMNNPKIKAALMFQGTPFKIFERRMVNFIRSGNVVKDLGEKVFNATKEDFKNGNYNNSRKILQDLRNIKADAKAGEQQVTANLFLNAAMQERDFFGSSTVSTFAKDVLITGAATYGGASAGMNLYHHFFHLPFFQSTTDEPTLNFNPGITAINRGIAAYKKRAEGDDEFLVTKIMQRFLGSGWYAALPDTARKLHRISIGDIPKIYQDDKYKYLFAIPATKK